MGAVEDAHVQGIHVRRRRTDCATSFFGVDAMAQQQPSRSVMELRQYKIAEGQREPFIKLFDREFVEPQEAAGIRLLGQFRDVDDGDRFTWIRTFASMKDRERSLNEFYSGPVWAANREKANPMLHDNDNVLLLKPAAAHLALVPPAGPRAAVDADPGVERLVIVTVHYLWKDPGEGFAEFFEKELAPLLEKAGLPILGAYVPETSKNTFPRLPVRQHEKLFAWFTRVSGPEAYQATLTKLASHPDYPLVLRKLKDLEERQSQTLRLQPTTRSLLR